MVTVVDAHPVPGAADEMGYSLEVFNALIDNLAVVTLPESHLEALRRDEMLGVRSLVERAA